MMLARYFIDCLTKLGFYHFQPLSHYLFVPSLCLSNNSIFVSVVHLLDALLNELKVSCDRS